MARRFLLTLALFVGLFWTIDAARAGATGRALGLLAMLGLGAALLWRNLSDASVGRRAGQAATLAFRPLEGLDGPGTPARVDSSDGSWDVLLDRTPQRGDLADTDAWRAWLWLGEDGLPIRVRRRSGGGVRHWTVLRAVRRD